MSVRREADAGRSRLVPDPMLRVEISYNPIEPLTIDELVGSPATSFTETIPENPRDRAGLPRTLHYGGSE